MLKKKEKSIKSTVGEERPKTFHLAISRDETILLFIVIFVFFFLTVSSIFVELYFYKNGKFS